MTDTIQKCVLCNHHGLCIIQGNGKQRVPCTGLKSDCKYRDNDAIRKQIQRHKTSVSSVVASKIANGHNQTATAIWVGKRGKGKSMAAGSVMESYAAKLCVLMKENPWEANPDKYFTIDNVGIIDMDDIMRALDLMKRPESRYMGFILDDVGKALDAREFMTPKNKLLNKIFQTCRTKNVFTELTIPDDSGLDRDPRENSDYFCIMEQSIHDDGLSIGRFFEQEKQYRSGKMWYVYVRYGGNPVMRHSFKLPSPKFIEQYEPRREANANKLFEDSMGQLKNMLQETKDKTESKQKVTRRSLLFPAITRLKEEGYNQRQISNILNIDPAEINRYLKGIT